ncbi:MAG: hypothetical protein A2Y38_08610 [Spirochaetes bacterium GWB1_59_5]|nr:MAG: hypothetical protein A2Y38_08610 [Spirochaetes bacterium GWB1_59_5]
MNLDDALKVAHSREIRNCPERFPNAAEVSSACNRLPARLGEARGLKSGDLIPVLAMAAVALLALALGPVRIMAMRPLASELVVAVPEDAGSRFLDFVLEAGESYRSVD